MTSKLAKVRYATKQPSKAPDLASSRKSSRFVERGVKISAISLRESQDECALSVSVNYLVFFFFEKKKQNERGVAYCIISPSSRTFGRALPLEAIICSR